MPSCSRYPTQTPHANFVKLDYDLEPLDDFSDMENMDPRLRSTRDDDMDMDLSDLDNDECVLETLGSQLARAHKVEDEDDAECPKQHRTFIIGDDFDDYDGDYDDGMDLEHPEDNIAQARDATQRRKNDEMFRALYAYVQPRPLYPPELDARNRDRREKASTQAGARRPVSPDTPSPPMLSGLTKRPCLPRSAPSIGLDVDIKSPPVGRSMSCAGYVGAWRV
ncbi:hypothetical protein K488DRAFT_83498 [Vararia minispora EC-137]|uniref:Uncharacterized protein n=1 Tax=Vararia minispora EC-137 TaxID=1314806 RepID=A0ACB8QT22_9AGAM|nr:hypothetical protein K488DRAFT_83498 [Vararia minispora EC-137]